jgi:hypothetical protein
MEIILENPQTGETMVLTKGADGKWPGFKTPWKVKGTPQSVAQQTVIQQQKAQVQSVVAVLAAEAGLPVADFLDAARWLLDKDCPFCQLATLVLRRVAQLGRAEAVSLVKRIKLAKDNQDAEALQLLRWEVQNVLDRQRG